MSSPTASPGSILVVIHNFVARSPDELSLSKGDRIELIERDDDFGDGWFLGKHMTNGNTGLFPEVYTRPAPRGIASVNPAPAEKRAVSEDFSSRQNAPSTPETRDRSSAPISMSPPNVTSQNSVMNETLDVIKEHINDMNTPRQTLHHRASRESGSLYARNRESYIRGHETDEEEHHLHTEDEVMTWTPARVAEYLEDQGVEKPHCEVFREQEISGEVLLNMEQSSIFIKEFELGSVGRRLKTWQKVKALQDEVRASSVARAPPSISEYSAAGHELGHHRTHSGATDMSRQRSSSMAGPASQYLSPNLHGHKGSVSSQTRSNTLPLAAPPLSPQSTSPGTPRFDGFARPSAQSIRSMNHSRRHSSLGSEMSMQKVMGPIPPATSAEQPRPPHARAGSSGGPDATQAKRMSSFGHKYNLSNSSHVSQAPQDWGLGPIGSPNDLDRGYFSGNDMDKRNRRSLLQKKSVSANHSRNPSGATDAGRPSYQSQAKVDSPQNNLSSGGGMFSKVMGMRATSIPKTTSEPHGADITSPVVTRLDYENPRSPTFSSETSSAGHSPANNAFSFFSKPRITGLRTASDSVTPTNEASISISKPSPVSSPARTGSTTPSTESRSIDQQKSEHSTRVSTGSSQGIAPANSTPLLPAPRARPRARSKKLTSAYTRGLEKKGPIEQIADCDYSGWMKKKSTSLVGSWKPRLFVLRGRRLSYYYSESDTEEKGLIDISGHRVLPASNDRVTGLHATLTGAKSPRPSEQLGTGSVQTSAATDLALHPSPFPNDEDLFIFKLVPPRQGLSKAVNFTKPTVHYFAVNSRQEGRLWMAALMKATIDYDSSGKVTTSYNQPTISLAKARARRERPPALREMQNVEKRADSGQGLGIGGLDGTEDAHTEGGADEELSTTSTLPPDDDDERFGSIAGSLRGKEAVTMIT
ncbi:PH-domain-containing protein [Myriangium duriaei CBS 260.36]|uniref:PH-domain-containing protein n=1 Tax=Myriangium duriaei CBS 260.36 TaxID=1168546 RepID=A0A9P4MHW8_9PEZI|nr:PH-domain-containing protein [Myriangium duriaei CBS 260.36]